MTPVVPTVTWDTERAFHCSHSTADSGPNYAADCSTDRASSPMAFGLALAGALLSALDEALGVADAWRSREGQDDSRCRTEQPASFVERWSCNLDTNPIHLATYTSMIATDACSRDSDRG